MTYCVLEYNEHGTSKRMNVLFKTRFEAEFSADMFGQLHAACRYEIAPYVPDQICAPGDQSAQRQEC